VPADVLARGHRYSGAAHARHHRARSATIARLRISATSSRCDIGRSSFTLEYAIVDVATDREVAAGKTVMVSYDYETARSVALPDATRSLLDGLRKGN
jgi:acyl-CoA thioesterase FadM